MAVVGWPAIATVREAARAWRSCRDIVPATGTALDPAGSAAMLRDTGGMARPLRLAIETVSLVAATEAIALPLGIVLALFLFRTDAWGRRLLLAVIGLSAFVPLPLHATAWLGALGNAGRAQAFGVRPILVGLRRGRGRACAGGLAVGRLDRGGRAVCGRARAGGVGFARLRAWPRLAARDLAAAPWVRSPRPPWRSPC